jgi:hypothetical protein
MGQIATLKVLKPTKVTRAHILTSILPTKSHFEVPPNSMDSSDSVSYDIQSLFYQGAYQSCIEAVQQNTLGSPSDFATQLRLLYGARSQIALNKPSAALALLPSSSIDTPAAQAVRGLANFVNAQNAKETSQADGFLAELSELLDQAVLGDIFGQIIRVCVATAMARDDDPVGALEVLGMGTGSSREIEWCVLPMQADVAITSNLSFLSLVAVLLWVSTFYFPSIDMMWHKRNTLQQGNGQMIRF